MMTDHKTKTARPSRRLWYTMAALLFAAVLLYTSLRGIRWGDVWHSLSHTSPGLVAASGLCVTLSLFLRAVRWRVLLRAAAPVRVADAFWATAAGYFGNNFLPARAGELVRSLMISSAYGLSRTFVLTTALSERLCDAISLVLISSIVLLTLPVKPGWFAHAAAPFTVLGLCGAAGIALLPRLERLCHRGTASLPLPAGLRDKLADATGQVMAGMRSFHDSGRLAVFSCFTGVIWFSDAVGSLLGMHALGLHGTLAIALLLTTGLALGSALPSTPGYVGIYQFVAVSILTPFGFSKTEAIAYILLFQALQYAIITFWGAWGLIRSRSTKAQDSHEALSASVMVRT
jgi:glycosyltransferase 2 family protein